MKEIGAATQRFLEDRPDLVLGTIRRDGAPQASPVWFLWDGGSFLVSTTIRTAKWHNLGRDRRCSVCVDDPSTGQMVVAYGRAVRHEEGVRGPTARLVAKYYPGDPERAASHVERIFAGDRRVLIEVVPDRIITRRLES